MDFVSSNFILNISTLIIEFPFHTEISMEFSVYSQNIILESNLENADINLDFEILIFIFKISFLKVKHFILGILIHHLDLLI